MERWISVCHGTREQTGELSRRWKPDSQCLSVAVRFWLTADPTTLFSSLFEFAIAQPESLAGMINRFSLAPAQPDYNRSYSTRVQIDVDSLIPFMLPCHFFRE